MSDILNYLRNNAEGIANAKRAWQIMIDLNIKNEATFYRLMRDVVEKYDEVKTGKFIKPKSSLGRRTVTGWWVATK